MISSVGSVQTSRGNYEQMQRLQGLTTSTSQHRACRVDDVDVDHNDLTARQHRLLSVRILTHS